MKRWLALGVLALTACQTTPPKELPYPPQRVFQNAYAFMPPHEFGWRVLARNPQQLAFARAGSNPDESFGIQGRVFPLPAYGSREEFFGLIRKALAEQAGDPRYRALKHDMVADSAKDATCLRSHFVAEDHKAVKRTATPGVMVLEVMTRNCAHPRKANLAVALVYSHRRYPEHADAHFAEKADRVLASLEFLE